MSAATTAHKARKRMTDNGEVGADDLKLLNLSSLRIADTEPLMAAGRSLCEVCETTHRAYCPRCAAPLGGHVPPKVRLPVPMDIYRHPRELEGKTTSVHAKLIAPDDTSLYVSDIHHDIDEIRNRYPDPSRVLMLFPTEDSIPLQDVPAGGFDRLVVIDGTWKHARSMCMGLQPLGFTAVRIPDQRTLFWRYQAYGDFCLATIEAIYWFYVELDKSFNGGAGVADGAFDNLLFYFKLQYETVQGVYRENRGKTFTRKKLDAASYINYDD
ncbi:DTW domain-containing protein 1 [Irineochytrium annulatum]|nr:DTW domain-containing protein 1 [Irineochytrium annulatum]